MAARRLTPVGERLEVAQGARRVAEAERREALAGGLGVSRTSWSESRATAESSGR